MYPRRKELFLTTALKYGIILDVDFKPEEDGEKEKAGWGKGSRGGREGEGKQEGKMDRRKEMGKRDKERGKEDKEEEKEKKRKARKKSGMRRAQTKRNRDRDTEKKIHEDGKGRKRGKGDILQEVDSRQPPGAKTKPLLTRRTNERGRRRGNDFLTFVERSLTVARR